MLQKISIRNIYALKTNKMFLFSFNFFTFPEINYDNLVTCHNLLNLSSWWSQSTYLDGRIHLNNVSEETFKHYSSRGGSSHKRDYKLRKIILRSTGSVRHNGVQVVCINHASAVMCLFISFFPAACASRTIIWAINLAVGHTAANSPAAPRFLKSISLEREQPRSSRDSEAEGRELRRYGTVVTSDVLQSCKTTCIPVYALLPIHRNMLM